MNDHMDELARDLQATCDASAEAYFGPAAFARFKRPEHVGLLGDPDMSLCFRGGCGDTMRFSFKLSGERIETARFLADGCGTDVICADAACHWLSGRTVAQAAGLTEADLYAVLGGLPEDKHKTARLVARTLSKAFAGRAGG